MNFQMFKLVLEKKKKNLRMRGQISSIPWIIEKPGEFQEKKKKILLLYWQSQRIWLCESQ